MNPVIQRFRSAFPNDPRTDEQLILVLGDTARSIGNTSLEDDEAFRNDYLDLKLAMAPSLPEEFGRAMRGGTNTAQAKLYDTLSLAGGATGWEGLETFGREGYRRNLEEAAEDQPTIQDVRDVRSPGEAMRWMVGLAGQQAPQLAGTIASGVAGGLGGLALGGPPGATIGAAVGTGLASFTQNQSYGELSDKEGASDVIPTAIGVGAFNALLDSIVPLKISSVLLRGATDKVAKQYLHRVLSATPINALTEGGTETAQEVVTIAGELYANRHNKDFTISPEQIKSRLINSAVAGTVLGGALGSVEAIPGPKPEPKGITTPAQTAQQTIPARPVVIPPSPAVINQSQAVQTGYIQPMTDKEIGELTGLAVREMEGGLPELEKDALLRTPEARMAYDLIFADVQQQYLQQQEAFNAATARPLEESPVEQRPGTAPLVQAEGEDRQDTPPVVVPREEDSRSDQFPEQEPEPINTRNLFKIASDFSSRLGRLTQLTEAQKLRLGIVRGLLNNPNSASIQNLAEFFGLTVDDSVEVMPQRFQFLLPAGYENKFLRNLRAMGPGVSSVEMEIGLLAEQYPDLAYKKQRKLNMRGVKAYAEDPEPMFGQPSDLDDPDAYQKPVPAPAPAPTPAATELRSKAVESVIARKTREKKPKAVVLPVSVPVAPVVPAVVPMAPAPPAAAPVPPAATGLYDASGNEVKVGDEIVAPKDGKKWRLDEVFTDGTGISATPLFIYQEGFPNRSMIFNPGAIGLTFTPPKKKGKKAKATAPVAPVPAAPVPVPVPAAPAAPVPDTPTPAAAPAHIPFDQTQFLDSIDWKGTFGKTGEPWVSKGLSATIGRFREQLKYLITLGHGAKETVTVKDEIDPKTGKKKRVGVSNKKFTRRITFFRNSVTGQIVGVGTYPSKDGVMVTNPDTTKKAAGINIDRLFNLIKNQQYIWQPLASARFLTEKHANVLRIELNSNEWENLLRAADDRKVLEIAKKESAVEVLPKRGKRTKDDGGIEALKEALGVEDVPEPPVPEDDRTVDPVFETQKIPKEQPGGIRQRLRGVTPDQVKSLWIMVSTSDRIGKTLAQIMADNFDFIKNYEKTYKGDDKSGIINLFHDLTPAFNAETFNEFYESFDPTGYRLYTLNSALRAKNIEPDPGANPEGGPGEVKWSLRERSLFRTASTSEVAARFNQLIQTLREFGLTVGLFDVLRTQPERGAYAPGERLIALGLHDMANPSIDNLRLAMHEAAHALFDHLPGDMQQRIANAIDRMSDNALGITGTADPSISKGNPKNLPNDVLIEERFAEWLAVQGVEMTAAKGIAQQIWRVLKAMYYRAALAVQEMWGREPSDLLALAYARNRFQQVLNGDAVAKSLFNFLIVPTPRAMVGDTMAPVLGVKHAEYYTEYSFSGGPYTRRENSSTNGLYGIMMLLEDNFEDKSGAAYSRDTPAQTQAAIERANLVLEAKLIALGIMTPDSQSAVEHNIKFSTRGERIGDRVMEEVIPDTQIAAFNEQLAVEAQIMGALEAIPEIVAALRESTGGPVTREVLNAWFIKEMGISNARKLIGVQMARISPVLRERVQANINQRVDEFVDPLTRDVAAYAAYGVLQSAMIKSGNVSAKAQEEINRLDEERNKAAEELDESEKSYLSMDSLGAMMERAVKRMVRKLIRDINRESPTRGVVMQQVAELDPSAAANVAAYDTIFRTLLDSKKISTKMVDLLDGLANDPGIDLNLPITELRRQMGPNPRYRELVEDTPDSRAMLATLIGYAKTNKRVVALLNLRRVPSATRRTQIMSGIATELTKELTAADRMRLIKGAAGLEERVKQAFAKDKREVDALNRKKEKLLLRVKAATLAIGYYDAAANRLAGRLELRAPYSFVNGAYYWLPPTEFATDEEIMENPIKTELRADGTPVDKLTMETHMSMMAAWVKNREDAGPQAMTGKYWTVKGQLTEMMLHGVVDPGVRQTDYPIWLLALSDFGTQAKAFGTASARLLGQMANRFAGVLKSLQPEGDRRGRDVERLRTEVVKVLAEGRKEGVSLENYLRHFYSPAVTFLEANSRTIMEAYPGNPARQWDVATERLLAHFQMDPVKRALISGKELRFIVALRRHIQSEDGTAGWFDATNNDEGVGVLDTKLMVNTQAGGEKKVGGQRKRMKLGLVTIPQSVSGDWHTAYNAMVSLNWKNYGEIMGQLRTALAQGGLTVEQVNAAVQKYFDHSDVNLYFLKALTRDMDTISPFSAPVMEDGTTVPEANPEFSDQAYDLSNGNVVAFARAMYALHGGSEKQTEIEYVVGVLGVFDRYFNEFIHTADMFNPSTKDTVMEWRSMVPGFMVNARTHGHWSPTWLSHVTFDRKMMLRANARTAAQIAFGINQERLAGTYTAMVEEANAALDKLNRAINVVKDTTISDNRAVVQAALEKEVGGKQELKRLRKLQQQMKFLTGSKSIRMQLFTFFRGMDSPVRPIRLGQMFTSLFASLMLNQPGSALGNLADVFTPLMTFGVSGSTIRMTLRTIGTGGIDATTGLLAPFGLQVALRARMGERWLELAQGDPLSVAKASDLLLKETSPFDDGRMNLMITGARKIQEAQSFGVGKKNSLRTVARPAAPFIWSAMVLNRALTIQLWNFANDFVARGVEFHKANQEGGAPFSDGVLATWTPEQWAEAMDLGKLETNVFVKLSTMMSDDWGLDFFRMVREGRANAAEGKDILSDRTLKRLLGMSMNSLTSEGNVATMPLASFNTTLIKFISPLLGWPFRRALGVSKSYLDVKGKASYAAVAQALMALTVAGAGGLAVSALVDLYNEELLRKRRNLRKLTLFQSPEQAGLAILEHTARVGTLGLWGDVANELFNVGTGEGHNRGISLDQRIVFVSSTLGILRSFSALFHQDFQADYAGFVRPMAYSMGGNGAMQYMQIANNVFGMDNIEAAATRRTNVGNWLRAVGRTLDFEIESAKGGYGTPTPVTPFITRMVLAAYEDDPSDFNEAYRDAVMAVRRTRKLDLPEAESFVKRAYQSRHPLRATFRATLSERDYQRLLNALPDSGRTDVRDGIGMINRYGERLGLDSFSGKTEEEPSILRPKFRNPEERFDPDEIMKRRQRAIAARYGLR